VAELGYEWIELSPRDDFLAWCVHPRSYTERIESAVAWVVPTRAPQTAFF
jgi:hypothetical protein